MVVQEERPHLTVEEWRALLDREHDAKYEYIDGQVYLMAGGTLDHSTIAINVVSALREALAKRPCRVYNSDAATRLSERRYTFPDASVTCDPGDRGSVKEIRVPLVIVEVLSESTEAYDRGDKFRYYRACPSVQEYVLILTRYQAVEVYRRTPEWWTFQSYGPDETIHLTSIDVPVPARVFYDDTDVPRNPDDLEGEV